MLPGPVFNLELITTSRRARYYALRVAYGLALLAIVWQNNRSWTRGNSGVMSPTEVSRLAINTFASIAILQIMLVLVMTPSLVAGVIANEKQRKTLHYLLSSTLTSSEIVVGKLMARMLHVVVMLGVGLPILSLLSLLGGIDPRMIVISVAATFSCAFFLAAISVLCSTLSRKVSEALTMSYAIAISWFVLPVMIRVNMPFYYPRLYPYIEPVNDWIFASTPWAVLDGIRALVGFGSGFGLVEKILWMIGLQLGAGLVLLGLAVWRLRPVFKNQEGSASTRFLGVIPTKRTKRVRFFGRKPVSNNPILWKETRTSRTTGAGQVASILISLAFVGFVGYWTYLYGMDAWNEMRDQGYAGQTNYRVNFNMFLRVVTTGLACESLLAAVVWSANLITTEHEDDTWISLAATPLQGVDVVLPKMIGILAKLKWLAGFVLILWIIGAICGVIHPWAVVLATAEFVSYACFATALGTAVSVRSKSTWKSQTLAMAILATVMGGYILVCCPTMNQGRWNLMTLVACAPFVLSTSIMNPWNFALFWSNDKGFLNLRNTEGNWMHVCFVSIALYAVGALLLGWDAIRRYDVAAGRAVRPRHEIPPPARSSAP